MQLKIVKYPVKVFLKTNQPPSARQTARRQLARLSPAESAAVAASVKENVLCEEEGGEKSSVEMPV